MRVGMGYDVHGLVPGRKLVLGGVVVPFARGLQGHSDADVLTHAVCDALLGAAGLGDIGAHFPDTDARYRDIESLRLLAAVGDEIRRAGFAVGNVDATVLAEAPRLAPFRGQMEKNIARSLEIEPALVNVKATTTEGLGFVGRGEGIAAMCVAMLFEGGGGR